MFPSKKTSEMMEKEEERDLSELIGACKEVYNTGINMKKAHFDKFIELIRNQFWHGGEKYALDNQPNKEFTDLVCEVAPGKTGFDWILQTIVKYCGRYINFQREKDLLKIATYCYIAWLKAGCHLQPEHDEDVAASGKANVTIGGMEEPAPVPESFIKLDHPQPRHTFELGPEEEPDA